jgi:hypothetical protein
MSRKRQRAEAELIKRRQKTEQRLADLRRSLDRELGGYLPTRRGWTVPLVGFACGFALAFAGRRMRPKKTQSVSG